MKPPKEIELEPGYYFSPGFYKSFWIKYIEGRLSDKVINTHVKLKPYREVWVGAVLAAAQTKVTGIPHFVGLSDGEPPDVLVVRFTPHLTARGRKGTNVERMPVEITRCSLDAGEDLFVQIIKKNKIAYIDNILAVYLYGAGKPFGLAEIRKQIMGVKKIYPSEVLVIAKMERAGKILLEPGTFAQIKLYPETGGDLVNISDAKAFFSHPAVMTATKRGVSRELKPLGSLKLMPPKL